MRTRTVILMRKSVAEVRALVRDSAVPVAEGGADENEPALYRSESDALAAAQVLATLEVAEQLRAANLIQVGANAARQVAEGTGSIDEYVQLYDRINPVIEKAVAL